MIPRELENHYKELTALVKAFLARKATIGQLREFVRKAEKREKKDEK